MVLDSSHSLERGEDWALPSFFAVMSGTGAPVFSIVSGQGRGVINFSVLQSCLCCFLGQREPAFFELFLACTQRCSWLPVSSAPNLGRKRQQANGKYSCVVCSVGPSHSAFFSPLPVSSCLFYLQPLEFLIALTERIRDKYVDSTLPEAEVLPLIILNIYL